ncbi:MAG TPA: hypothetical protein VL225_17320 [Vicinamibacterales bacterium]|jgi:hypothetical protein|nr:hypothetical protein [Vicinamibacterales bacterium]
MSASATRELLVRQRGVDQIGVISRRAQTQPLPDGFGDPVPRRGLRARQQILRHIRLHIVAASKQNSAMATSAQRAAARRNIKRAAAAASRKRTIAHLPKRTRTALGKQGAKVAKRKKR